MRGEPALGLLAGTRLLVTVGTRVPVAFFAYPGKARPPDAGGLRRPGLVEPAEDGPGALEALVEALGAVER